MTAEAAMNDPVTAAERKLIATAEAIVDKGYGWQDIRECVADLRAARRDAQAAATVERVLGEGSWEQPIATRRIAAVEPNGTIIYISTFAVTPFGWARSAQQFANAAALVEVAILPVDGTVRRLPVSAPRCVA